MNEQVLQQVRLVLENGTAVAQVGSKVTGRVLSVDPVRRRTSLTLKKALVESKLKPVASWEVHSLFPPIPPVTLRMPLTSYSLQLSL